MRVVCIHDGDQIGLEEIPRLKKGNVYTVMKVHKLPLEVVGRLKYEEGDYYELFECGAGNVYFHSMFQIINEDQQDETEMEREYNFEKQLTNQLKQE